MRCKFYKCKILAKCHRKVKSKKMKSYSKKKYNKKTHNNSKSHHLANKKKFI